MKLYLKEKIHGKDYINVKFSSLFWAYTAVGFVTGIGFLIILYLLDSL